MKKTTNTKRKRAAGIINSVSEHKPKNGRISKQGAWRYQELLILQKQGKISKLQNEFTFYLYGKSGKAIARYTADYIYRLEVEMYGLKPKTNIIEEYKGSKNMWAYKRSDYPLRRRWVMADYPGMTFIENINGKIQFPRVIYPKI